MYNHMYDMQPIARWKPLPLRRPIAHWRMLVTQKLFVAHRMPVAQKRILLKLRWYVHTWTRNEFRSG